MPRQALAYSSNEQRSLPLDAARLVNLYPEAPPLGARAPSLQVGISSPIKSVLYNTPGLKPWQTLGMGRARAGRYALGYFWVLYGSTLYRVEEDGTSTACVGDAIPPTGTAMMSDNGIQLALMVGTALYVVGQTAATGSFKVTAGTYDAGTNEVASVVIDGVTITGGAIDWTTNNKTVAAAIAASINATTSSPDYTAETNGATVIITAVTPGPGPNGFGVVINVGGDVAVSPSGTSMSGGADTETTVTLVADADFPAAGISSIDYVDGYIVYTVAVSAASNRQWGITALFDATSIDPLDFASAESTSSDLLRVLVSYEEVWLFSQTGISVWRNTGASPFPFERIPGAVLEKGCLAALSPAKIDASVFWLGNDKKVYRSQGYQPVRISTHGIEYILESATDLTDAEGMAYSQAGHDFYVLTLPTLGRTFVYDNATQGWHERQSGTSIVPAPWDVRWIAPAFGKVYAGLDGGQLCELDLDTYTDAGDPIRRVIWTAPLFADGKEFVLDEVEVECELGVGIPSGQGSDPLVVLRFSDDGTATWSNERSAPLGPQGRRKPRALFRRLGTSRQKTLEFSVSDPVKVAFYGMRYEAEVMVD